MNKRNGILIAIFMLLSSSLNFAGQESVTFDQARYNVILQAFQENRLSIESKNVDFDIAIVQEHKKSLEDRLAQEKKIFEELYAPMLLKIVGGGFAGAAVIGGLGSAISAGAISVLLSREGISYWSFLNEFYTLAYRLRSRISPRMLFVNYEKEELGLIVGALAPSVAGISLVSAGIAKYLFNKAASYKKNIVELEKEIKRDDQIIANFEQIILRQQVKREQEELVQQREKGRAELNQEIDEYILTLSPEEQKEFRRQLESR